MRASSLPATILGAALLVGLVMLASWQLRQHIAEDQQLVEQAKSLDAATLIADHLASCTVHALAEDSTCYFKVYFPSTVLVVADTQGLLTLHTSPPGSGAVVNLRKLRGLLQGAAAASLGNVNIGNVVLDKDVKCSTIGLVFRVYAVNASGGKEIHVEIRCISK